MVMSVNLYFFQSFMKVRFEYLQLSTTPRGYLLSSILLSQVQRSLNSLVLSALLALIVVVVMMDIIDNLYLKADVRLTSTNDRRFFETLL